MQKGLIRKGLVFSVIILFISVGVQPVFAGESITTTITDDEDCIECQESDRISLLRAKILLFRVKVVTNVILSSKLGEIPEIKEDCQEILDVINSDKPLYDRPICDTLFSSIITIEYIFGYLDVLSQLYPNIQILQTLYILFASIYDILNAVIFILMIIFDCM